MDKEAFKQSRCLWISDGFISHSQWQGGQKHEWKLPHNLIIINYKGTDDLSSNTGQNQWPLPFSAAWAAMGGDTLAVWPTAASSSISSISFVVVVLVVLVDESRAADQEAEEEEEAAAAALPCNTTRARRAINNFSSQLGLLIELYYFLVVVIVA